MYRRNTIDLLVVKETDAVAITKSYLFANVGL